MKKGLLLELAMVLAFMPTSPLLAQNKADSSGHPNKASEKNPVPQGSIIVQQVNSPYSTQEGQQKSPPTPENEPDYVALGFWVNLGLTVITLLIAISAVIQASAAKQGTRAILRSERAWLLPDGNKLGMPYLMAIEEQQRMPQQLPVHCLIALKNCGNTPASAVNWQFELQIGDSAEAPPSFEIYTKAPPKELPTPFPIGEGEFGHAKAILTPQKFIDVSDKAEIEAEKKFIWLCGIAVYRDVFERRRMFRRTPEEHRTLVCLRYICSPRAHENQWVLGGPSGYNDAK